MKRKTIGLVVLLSAMCVMLPTPPRLSAQPPAPPATSGSTFSLVTGTVAYRERIALPPNAVLRVRLEDTSRQDVASTLIAEVNLPANGRQVPLPFAIPYRASDIIANHRYQVRAQILAGDSVRYQSTTAYPVLTNGAPTSVSILVQARVALSETPTAKLEETYWKLTFLSGQTPLVPVERREPQITLHKEGKKLTGTGGCNQMFGTYTLAGNTLKFSGIGGTMMACPEPQMKQERLFTEALKATTSYRIKGEALELLAGGKTVARFQSVYLR